MDVTTIGIDLAKHVFQVHGVDKAGGVVVRKALRRSQVLPFSPSCCPASWVWKRAGRRITGRVSWWHSGIR